MKYFLVVSALVCASALAAPSAKSLQDDFKEFINLIPVAELKKITCSYKDDPEVQLAVQYLRSEEFAGLVKAVREKKTWIEFKDYLSSAGIDVEAVIGFIHGLIVNGVCESTASSRTLKNLLEDLKAAIPVDKIKTLFYEKIQNSADFKEFFGKVSSEKSRALVEEVIAMEEFQRIAAKLQELGFDLKKFKDFIYGLFGWN